MSVFSSGNKPTYYSLGNLVQPNVNSYLMAAKAKSEADVDLQKLKAAAVPDLKEYEEKLKTKALTGNKQQLLYEYRSITNDLKKGVSKYGGDWLTYANTDDYKKTIGRFDNFLLNVNTAEQRYKNWNEDYTKMDENERQAEYIGPDWSPVPKIVNGKVVGTYTNQDMFEELERRSLNKNGMMDLDLPGFRVGSEEDFVKAVQGFATNLGITTTDKGLQISPEALNNEVGGTFYSYLITKNPKVTFNKGQLEAAANAFTESMDDKARTALMRDWYSHLRSGGKTKDFNKFALDKARNVLSPMSKYQEDLNLQFHKGKTGLGAKGEEANRLYWAALYGGDKMLSDGLPVQGTAEYNGSPAPATQYPVGKQGFPDKYKQGTPLSTVGETFYFMNKKYSVNNSEFAGKNPTIESWGTPFMAYWTTDENGKYTVPVSDIEVKKALYGLPASAPESKVAQYDLEIKQGKRPAPQAISGLPLVLNDDNGNPVKVIKNAPGVNATVRFQGIPALSGLVPDKNNKLKEKEMIKPSTFLPDDLIGLSVHMSDDLETFQNEYKNRTGEDFVTFEYSDKDSWFTQSKNVDNALVKIMIPMTDPSMVFNDAEGTSKTYSNRFDESLRRGIQEKMGTESKEHSVLNNVYGK